VLPVQFLSFTGLQQNTQVLLNWTIIASKEVERFEVERSLDNATYIHIGIVSDTVKLNEQQSFGYTDNISSINSDIIYYRLKVIGKTGDVKYSSVLTVRKNKANTAVTIIPNPVRDYVSVRFFVEKESEVTIRLVDDIGKTVMMQKQSAAKGNNIIHLIGLAKYGTGVYTMQVLVNNEIVTQKMILTQ
jgi:Secretion system C-terminal sorting domain